MARDQYAQDRRSSEFAELREKRKYTRITVNVPATLTILQLEAYHTGFILNISMGGCLLSTPEKMLVGAECQLAITVGEGLETEIMTLPGRIVRSDGAGLGIEFTELHNGLRRQLKRLISRYDAA